MKSRIKLLQKILINQKWDATLVPKTDQFLGEYIAKYSDRLKWISGFSGSSAIAIVLKTKAAIFTDGRYTNQIIKEVNSKIFEIHHIKNFNFWLYKNLKNKSTLAIDPFLFSNKDIVSLKKNLNSKKISFIFTKKNPIDMIWKNKPKKPCSKAFILQKKFSGKKTISKFNEIRKDMKRDLSDYYFTASLDSIAWITNLRGKDLEYSPLNLAYFLLPSKGKAILYINLNKISKNIFSRLNSIINFVDIKYIKDDLKYISKFSKISVDSKKTPYWFTSFFKFQNLKVKFIEDYVYIRKAIKNKIEINGSINANIRDGASITKFLYWIDNYKKNNLSENKASKKLLQLRKKNKYFFSLSFQTISAYGKNAALPHYTSSSKKNNFFKKNNIYLFDSGGQYFDGTTDITRTIIIGRAKKEQKEYFTRVLKGHISLIMTKFKNTTRGSDIDYIARKSLNEINSDYDHGTGHGIGSFLNVHEGPQRISKSIKNNDSILKPGMILSIEPGYYKINSYGIRIENLVIIKKEKKDFLSFQTISFAPIDKNLILPNLLTHKEKKWLNEYHQNVFVKLYNYLNNNEKKWLKKIIQPL